MPLKATTVNPVKKCNPFILEVKVFSPKSGYRIHIVIEKDCTPQLEAKWALVFDLDKKIDGEFVQIVHVSFRPKDAQQEEGIKKMTAEGMTKKQAKLTKEKMFQPMADMEGQPGPTPEQKKKMTEAAAEIATAEL